MRVVNRGVCREWLIDVVFWWSHEFNWFKEWLT